MKRKCRKAIEKDDTKLENVINRLLDIIELLKWPIRIGVIIIAFLIFFGKIFQPFRSLLGFSSLLVLFFLPELTYVIIGNVHHKFVFPHRVDETDQTTVSAFEGSNKVIPKVKTTGRGK